MLRQHFLTLDQGLLQNSTVITNCNNFLTKCDSYYKMQYLLQIASVHTQTPKNAKNLRRFWGFQNYVQQFIPNYSTIKCTHRTLERTLTQGSQF